eukprot:2794332-Amphidinium_carterae.1
MEGNIGYSDVAYSVAGWLLWLHRKYIEAQAVHEENKISLLKELSCCSINTHVVAEYCGSDKLRSWGFNLKRVLCCQCGGEIDSSVPAC